MNSNNKNNIRKHFLALRKQHQLINSHSKLASQQFIAFNRFITVENYGSYLAMQDELDTKYIHDYLTIHQKNIYAPKILKSKQMVYATLNKNELMTNQFGISEPNATAEIIETQALNIVFIPLVAFNRQGNRLGMGGGYYDRHFNYLLTPSTKPPLLIGLGFSLQECVKLKTDPWDINLDVIITEKEVIICNDKRYTDFTKNH